MDRDREVADLISQLTEVQTRERQLQEEGTEVLGQLRDKLGRATLTGRRDWDRLVATAQAYRAERNLLRLVAGLAADTADLSP